MKAALIFAEMRGTQLQMRGNIAAHKIYQLWRKVHNAELEDGNLIAASKLLDTDQLATLAARIYATGMTSEETP